MVPVAKLANDECRGTEEKNANCASMFMVAVVTVPGHVPLIVTVPTASREMSDNPTGCETCSVVEKLLDDVVVKGAMGISAEIRKSLRPIPEVSGESESTTTATNDVHSD